MEKYYVPNKTIIKYIILEKINNLLLAACVSGLAGLLAVLLALGIGGDFVAGFVAFPSVGRDTFDRAELFTRLVMFEPGFLAEKRTN